MAAQNSAEFRDEFWDRMFPEQLPHSDIDIDVVDENGFDLEGVKLLPIEVGHTDSDATTNRPAGNKQFPLDVYSGNHVPEPGAISACQLCFVTVRHAPRGPAKGYSQKSINSWTSYVRGRPRPNGFVACIPITCDG